MPALTTPPVVPISCCADLSLTTKDGSTFGISMFGFVIFFDNAYIDDSGAAGGIFTLCSDILWCNDYIDCSESPIEFPALGFDVLWYNYCIDKNGTSDVLWCGYHMEYNGTFKRIIVPTQTKQLQQTRASQGLRRYFFGMDMCRCRRGEVGYDRTLAPNHPAG